MTHNALTLYELNNLVAEGIRVLLPNDYWVEAELSELRVVRGNCYMEIVQKDLTGNTPIAKAQAKCWRNAWPIVQETFERVTGQQFRVGMKVMLLVRADFHEAYGFSWIVTNINPEFTLGDMAKRRHEIVAQLKAAGIFDLQKDLTLPLFAQNIAVISSEKAAGYGDFCSEISKSGFAFRLHLYAASMQGEQVESSIIDALDRIYEDADNLDAVVIIRGGGATSDLSGFDSLALAENIANFPLSVITGIGHDRDQSIADMVANRSLKTPTAVAAFLVDNLHNTLLRIEQASRTAAHEATRMLDNEKHRLQRATQLLPTLFSTVGIRERERLNRKSLELSVSLQRRLAKEQGDIDLLVSRLQSSATHKLLVERQRTEALALRLAANDPQLLLQRGYSITTQNGRVVKDARHLKDGDQVETRLHRGAFASIVQKQG